MKEESSNNANTEVKILIYSSKEVVHNYLNNFSLDEIKKEKIKNIKEDEIDGEALIILMENDLLDKLNNHYGIKPKGQKKLLREIETDIFRENSNVKNDNLYEEIFTKDFETLCNSLENKLDELKFGQRLKYIKYLILKKKPNKENRIELKNYLDNIMISKEYNSEIIEQFDNLLKLIQRMNSKKNVMIGN